jgi:glycosyltransferase involved in cell wall biosynthesis
MKIAYLINQYPKVSHSFIRREILAMERLGFEVERIAVRGWDVELVDQQDLVERDRTYYILRSGMAALAFAVLRMLITSPINFLHALRLTLKMGWRAERSMPYHIMYLAEACLIVPMLRKKNIQHVHAHFGTNSAEVVMLATALGGPPYSITIHGSEEFDKPEFIGLREKVARSTFVAAVSSFGRSQIYRWTSSRDWPKVHVVHCGVDPIFYSVPAVPVPDTPRVVCVGRLSEPKGQLILIEAIGKLVRKGLKIELVLAGDGEMRKDADQLIAKLGVSNHVRITGSISSEQVRAEILAARALILPSFMEGLPVAVMEAMVLRRPVLCTCIAGVPELVRDGIEGWLFPAGDVDALATAIETLLSTPTARLDEMGAAGHLRALERHSVDTESAKLAQHFRDTHQLQSNHDEAIQS